MLFVCLEVANTEYLRGIKQTVMSRSLFFFHFIHHELGEMHAEMDIR
jgi:hypothetical protein